MYEEREIDLVSMAKYLVKRWWIIVLGMLIGFGVSAGYMYERKGEEGWQVNMAYAIPNVYQNGDKIVAVTADITTSVSDYISDSLKQNIGISTKPEVTGRTIEISFWNKEEGVAKKVHQYIQELMIDEVPTLFNINAPICTLNSVTSVEASVNKKYVLAGSALGLCIPLLLFMVLYVVQDRVWTENELPIKCRSKASVLYMDKEKKDKHNEEVLFMLSNYVVRANANVAVVSINHGEGKTYLCERLAESRNKDGEQIDNEYVFQDGASTLTACEFADIVIFMVESGRNSAKSVAYYIDLLAKMGKETCIIINKCSR